MLSYAFLVHGKGPAVNDVTEDFDENDDDSETSSNVVIRNNDIRNIKCWTKEIPGKRAPIEYTRRRRYFTYLPHCRLQHITSFSDN